VQRFVFDLIHDRWIWKAVDDGDKVVSRCKGSFAYYLDAVEDAKANGFNGKPFFISVKGAYVSPLSPHTGKPLE
jgi:hypothetical protein